MSPVYVITVRVTTFCSAMDAEAVGASPEVPLRLFPYQCADLPPERSAVHIAVLEMNPSVAPRHSRLIGGFRECRPCKRDRSRGSRTRVDLRRACRDRYRQAKRIAPGEELQDLGSCRAVRAVAGDGFREGRGDERGRLEGPPVLAP